MLVRSASTPVLGALLPSGCHSPAVSSPAVHFAESPAAAAYHPPTISCHLAGPGSGSDHERSRGRGAGMRRTCSEDNLASLAGGRADDHRHHHLPPSGKGASRARPVPLETIESFRGREASTDDEEEEDDAYEVERELRFGQFSFPGGSAYSQEHPLFLARGLGIDRLGSGLLSADGGGGGDGGAGFGGSDGGGGGNLVASGNGGDRSGIEMHYKKMIEEDPCNGLFLRNYAQFLYQASGGHQSRERGLLEGRGVLLPCDTRRPRRRRAPVGVRQAGVGRAPRRGARLQLLRAGGQGFPAQQPRPRRARRLPVGHGRRRRRRRRRAQLRGLRSACALVSGFGDNLNTTASLPDRPSTLKLRGLRSACALVSEL